MYIRSKASMFFGPMSLCPLASWSQREFHVNVSFLYLIPHRSRNVCQNTSSLTGPLHFLQTYHIDLNSNNFITFCKCLHIFQMANPIQNLILSSPKTHYKLFILISWQYPTVSSAHESHNTITHLSLCLIALI